MGDQRYTDAYGPNVQAILLGASRIIRGKVPMQVRRELSAAVRAGVLGHLPKDGLKPEIFFHPDHLHGARERQAREAAYAIGCIASVTVSPKQFRDGLGAQGIDPLQYALTEESALSKAEGRSLSSASGQEGGE